MKIFFYLITLMFILCPINSNVVEVGPDFEGIRLGTNINNIKAKLYSSLYDNIPEDHKEMILDAHLEHAQSLCKDFFRIKEKIDNVLYYKINDTPTSSHLELYINDKGEVVCITAYKSVIKKIFKTTNRHEVGNIFNKKYHADIYPNTNINYSIDELKFDTYHNNNEKWKAVVNFTRKQNITSLQIFRYEHIGNITKNNSNNETPLIATNQSTNNTSSIEIEKSKHNNSQNSNTKLSNNNSPQNETTVKEPNKQSDLNQNNTYKSIISNQSMLKLVVVILGIIFIIFMVYGFILWKRARICCFFTGWIDYLIIFFTIISIPLICFIFDSNNETEKYIMGIASITIPTTLLIISMIMTFLANYKYGAGIFLSLYATIYKLICIIFIVLIIISIIAHINARFDKRQRIRNILNRV